MAWDYLLEERAVLLLVLRVLQKVLELRDEVGDRELPARRGLEGLTSDFYIYNPTKERMMWIRATAAL